MTLLSLCSATVPYVFADESSSAHFMVKNGDTNDFGGISTSTNFSFVSAGGQTQNGTSTSASFALDSGQLYFDSFAPVSQNWQWYDDEANETPTIPLASENVAPSNINANTIKLRISVAETGKIGAAGVKFRLQFSTVSDFSTGATNVADQASCDPTSKWCYDDGGGVDNAVITTGVLTDSDSCVASVGSGCGTHNESGTSISSFTHAASTTAEYEFTIHDLGAAPNTVYFFRLFDTASSSSVPVNPNTGASNPSLATGGTTLDFSINGLESGTSTAGVTTDINTSAESVAFGTLPLASSVKGAQRLAVTTNATQGYRIFAFARQGLLGTVNNTEINPVIGTNDAPLGWNSSCDPGAAGCYGYHTGENVLGSGNPTRFSADDTYAQFSTTTASEVAYSAVPVTDKKTDIVYRVLVRNVQSSGDYSGTVVYIVTPVF